MLGYIEIVIFKKKNFLYQGKERPAKKKIAASAESLFSWIFPRKRIFKKNHFNLFIRGPDGFDSWKEHAKKISWHIHFKFVLYLRPNRKGDLSYRQQNDG